MATVTTYQLAYRTSIQTTLCDACVERDDHGRGSLGPVQHGRHRGMCLGRQHRGAAGVVGPEDDVQREIDEVEG